MANKKILNLLEDLEITKVAFVPAGADDEAHIKIVKSKDYEGGGTNMTFEEILKSMKPEDAEVIRAEVQKAADAKATAEAAMADEKAKAEKLAGEKATLETEVAKLKEGSKKEDEEDILKGLDPKVAEIIQKAKAQAAAAESAILKMKEAQVEQEAETIAKSIDKIGVKTDDLKNIYKSLKGLDEKLCKSVFDVLEQAQKGIESGDLFKSKGSDGEDGAAGSSDEAWAKIEKAAQDYMVKNPGVTKEIAIAKTIDLNPELYDEYSKTLK